MTASRKTSKPNIRKRGNTYTWFAYITAGNGTRRQISQGGFRTIAEAETDRIAALNDIGQGNYVTPNKTTLAHYLMTEWLPTRRVDLEPSTWRSYEQKLRLHVVPHIGAIPLQELTPVDLNKLYAQLLGTTNSRPRQPANGHRQLSPGSSNSTTTARQRKPSPNSSTPKAIPTPNG